MEVQTNIKNKELVSKRRLQIIQAASKLFFEKGFDRTTMREISRVSGLTMGSLYDYVRSKDDILVLVYEDVVERFRSSLVENEKEGRSADPKDLEIILRRIMGKMYEMTKAVQLLYRESWSKRKDVHLQMREIDRKYVGALAQLLQTGNRMGWLRVDNPAVTADLIFLVAALPALREWSLSKIKRDQVVDTVVNFILQGLSAPEKQKSHAKLKDSSF
jgi:TetR/AcrR family transcriptional regulator, cholesterol catabolism regulator